MRIVTLDHLVLTVASIPATVAFYERVLGMTAEVFGPDQRWALRFGSQKINLHQADTLFEPKAERPTMGSADLCFIVDTLDGAEEHLARCGVPILVARSPRTGTHGPITSIYVRDPDLNLIELSVYPKVREAAA